MSKRRRYLAKRRRAEKVSRTREYHVLMCRAAEQSAKPVDVMAWAHRLNVVGVTG